MWLGGEASSAQLHHTHVSRTSRLSWCALSLEVENIFMRRHQTVSGSRANGGEPQRHSGHAVWLPSAKHKTPTLSTSAMQRRRPPPTHREGEGSLGKSSSSLTGAPVPRAETCGGPPARALRRQPPHASRQFSTRSTCCSIFCLTPPRSKGRPQLVCNKLRGAIFLFQIWLGPVLRPLENSRVLLAPLLTSANKQQQQQLFTYDPVIQSSSYPIVLLRIRQETSIPRISR